MRRREFIAALGGAAAWPLAGRAQPASMPVVGFLRSTPSEPFAHLVTSFREGLRETGLIEGQHVRVEYRYADNDLARLRDLASDLVRLKPAVIVANGFAVRAVRDLDSTVPVVFVFGDDPVKSGLVASLNRPGGNTTGVTFFGGSSLDVKRLELLDEIIPRERVIAVLIDREYSTGQTELPHLKAAASALGRTIAVTNASVRELDSAFEAVVKTRAGGLLVSGSPLFTTQHHALIALAARHRLPASYDQRAFVEAGGLMSYGADFPGAYRQAGIYVGRIMSGIKAADLPVEQPTKFELVVNLRTAKALGLDLPLTLLARADEIIE